jgi:hypothetical protein
MHGRSCAGGGLDLFFFPQRKRDVRQNVGGELGGVRLHLRIATPLLDRSLRFVKYLLFVKSYCPFDFLQSNAQFSDRITSSSHQQSSIPYRNQPRTRSISIGSCMSTPYNCSITTTTTILTISPVPGRKRKDVSASPRNNLPIPTNLLLPPVLHPPTQQHNPPLPAPEMVLADPILVPPPSHLPPLTD